MTARSRLGVVAAVGGLLLAVPLGAALAAASARTSVWLAPVAAVALVFVVVAVRSPLAATAIAFVALPIGLHHVFGPLKVAQVLALLVVGGVVVDRLGRGRAPLPLPATLRWAVVLTAVGLVSTATALDPSPANRQVVDVAIGTALAAAVVAVAADRRSWLVLCRAFVLGGIAVTAPALLSAQHLQAHFGGSVVEGRPVGIFSQPNELGAFSMLVLLVGLGLLLARPTRWDRRIAVVAVVCSTGALLLSLSRGAWIGATLGVVVLLVTVPRSRLTLGASAAAVVLAGGLLGAFAPDAPQVHVISKRLTSLGHAEQNPYDDRPRIWREAVREIRARPLLGEGPDNFPTASTRSISQAATVEADHAHDVMLTVAAETGLTGAAVLLALTVTAAATIVPALGLARRRRDRVLEGVLGGLVAALAALLGEGLVDFTFRNFVVAFGSWSVLALAIAGAAVVRRSGRP